MQPSNFVSGVARRLRHFIDNQTANDNLKLNDVMNSDFRRTNHLCQLNILKVDVFSYLILKDLQYEVPAFSLPFLDLPNSKLEGNQNYNNR